MLNPELEQLVALADLDDEIARHQKARADALAAVPTADKVVAAAVAAHDAAKAALAAHAPKESAIDRQMDDYKVQRGRAVRALETGMGDAAAAERQQAQCEAILDRLETELLGLFEALADCSLLRFPPRHRDRALPGTLPCGARTFLPSCPKTRPADT
jgi:hypothetical protein